MNKSCKELKRISRGALIGNWGGVILAFFLTNLIVNLATLPFQGAFDDYTMSAYADIYAELGMADLISAIDIPATPSNTQLIIAYVAIIIISLVSTVLTAGLANIHLSVLRGEKFDLMKIFKEFKKRPDRYIVATLLATLIIVACAVVYVAGVSVVSLAYGLINGVVGTVIFVVGMLLLFIAYLATIFYFVAKYSQFTFILVENPEVGALASLKESARLMKGNYMRYLYMIFSFIPLELLGLLSLGIGSYWINPYVLTVQAAFYMDITGEFQRREEEARRLEEEMGPVLTE